MRANPHPTNATRCQARQSKVSILECERTRTRPIEVNNPTPNFISFNPRVRANPHPTSCLPGKAPRIKFQSSSASEPAPDGQYPRLRKRSILFQSSSASEPAPDTRLFSFLPPLELFQSSSASEPAPDKQDFLIRGALPGFNPRVRANPHPTQSQFCKLLANTVSILECERTRTRPDF